MGDGRWLRWVAGVDAVLAESIIGDLAEERLRRVSRVGPLGAALWHWHAMAAVGGHMTLRRIGERIRDALSGFAPGNGRKDLRHAVRSLRRSPWYALTVVLVVAMSMTLATTVFAVVDGVLFRPLPYPDSDELFAVSGVFDDEPGPPERLVREVSPAEINAWSPSIPDVPVTLLGYSSVQFEDGTFARAATVDSRFFEVFGVRMLMGGFADADFDPTQSRRPIVISHSLWQTRFGGDPDIIGFTYSLPAVFPGRPPQVVTVVGVMNRDGFVPPRPGEPDDWVRRESRVDALFPFTLDPTFGERIGTAFVRVEPGRVAAAGAALQPAVDAFHDSRVAELAEWLADPDRTRGQRLARAPYDRVVLQPVSALLTTRQRPILTLIFATALGLTVLVLLNIGALAAARAQRRLTELVVRRSLGARTLDLFRSALAEQAVLVAAGLVLGALAAPWLLSVASDQMPPGLLLIKDPRMDWRVGAFAAAVATAMTVAIATLTVRYAVRHAAPGAIASGRHGRAPAEARAGRLLVMGQVAVAFSLVLGGVMFITSLGSVWNEDPGIRSSDAAMVSVSFGEVVETARETDVAVVLRTIPGVTAAGALDATILDNFERPSSTFRGPDGQLAEEPRPQLMQVGSGFLEAAGIRLLDGRFPTGPELDTGAPVVVVSDTLAGRYWPGASAVGQTLLAGQQAHTVVGVIRAPRLVALDVEPTGVIIAPLGFARPRTTGANVFVAMEPGRTLAPTDVASALAAADPAVRIRQVQSIEEALAASIRPRSVSALAASAFAISAVALVAIGIFGLVAHTAGRRAHEMGIRLTLGDTPSGVVRRVMFEPLAAVVAGLLIGGAVAAVAARAVSAYLYDIGTYDVSVWVATVAVIVATAALGAAVPALRSGRVDPAVALREHV